MWLTDAKADSVVHYSGDARGLDARDHLGTSRSRRTASVEARASLKRRGKAPLGNTISVRVNAIYCQKLCRKCLRDRDPVLSAPQVALCPGNHV